MGTIDQHAVRSYGQVSDSNCHGTKRCFMDVMKVDFVFGNHADTHQPSFDNLPISDLPKAWREQFGIAYPTGKIRPQQTHGRCHHGTRKRTAANLIHACNGLVSKPMQAPFQPQQLL